MPPDLDDADLRRYLLGLLPEGEAEGMEEAYLGRTDVWERVRGVEDDLLDDYAAGRLDPSENAAFETRYLASAPLRARVAAAQALRRAISERAPAGHGPSARVSHPARWAALAIAASVLLAVIAGGLWRPRAPVGTSTSPPAAAGLKTPPPPAPAAAPVILALSPVLLRGQGDTAELRIPPGTDTVTLELQGDPGLAPRTADTLEALVRTVEGAVVWQGAAARGHDTARPGLLAVTRIPVDRLAPGDYLVTLSAPGTEDTTLARYFFRVAR